MEHILLKESEFKLFDAHKLLKRFEQCLVNAKTELAKRRLFSSFCNLYIRKDTHH